MKRQFGKIWIVLLGLAVMSSPALARDHGHDRDAYHSDWYKFLSDGTQGLYVLGCLGRDEAYALPYPSKS